MTITVLADDFSVVRSDLWQYATGNSVVGGQLVQQVTTAYSTLLSVRTDYDVTDGGPTATLVPPPPGTGDMTTEAFLGFNAPGGARGDGPWLDIQRSATGSSIACVQQVNGASTQLATATYDPVAHKWLRLRTAAGVVYFDVSPNAVSWTTLASSSTWVGRLRGVQPYMGAGYWSNSGNQSMTGTAAWDNFQMLGDPTRYALRPPSYIKNMPFSPPMVVGVPQGLAVLRIGGQWINTEVATQDQINSADYYFPGGADTPVDAATAALLTAAGYTVITS